MQENDNQTPRPHHDDAVSEERSRRLSQRFNALDALEALRLSSIFRTPRGGDPRFAEDSER